MATHIFKIENGKLLFSLTDPKITDVCSVQESQFAADYTCAVTSGALSATQNVTSEAVPATWCEPEQQTPKVGATSYTLDLSFLQDPDVIAGLSRFLFEHDTQEAWVLMGMDGDNPPKAVAKIRLVAGTIGGAGRTTLTATVSLPVEGKPSICFGDAAGSVGIGNPEAADPLDVTFETFGANLAPFADKATLVADGTYGDTAKAGNSDPAMTTGQFVLLSDGTAKASWDGTNWQDGAASAP